MNLANVHLCTTKTEDERRLQKEYNYSPNKEEKELNIQKKDI
jgi:hypothetical protein